MERKINLPTSRGSCPTYPGQMITFEAKCPSSRTDSCSGVGCTSVVECKSYTEVLGSNLIKTNQPKEQPSMNYLLYFESCLSFPHLNLQDGILKNSGKRKGWSIVWVTQGSFTLKVPPWLKKHWDSTSTNWGSTLGLFKTTRQMEVAHWESPNIPCEWQFSFWWTLKCNSLGFQWSLKLSKVPSDFSKDQRFQRCTISKNKNLD